MRIVLFLRTNDDITPLSMLFRKLKEHKLKGCFTSGKKCVFKIG